ncbi:MAG TPA: hypothetical protein PK771_02280 [Spirochaetota bacterium]|nr:hypothetical protein [Spirochaetota bacterium]
MKVRFLFIILMVYIAANLNVYGENIYFFTRGGFSISQFWSGDTTGDTNLEKMDNNDKVHRKYFSNFLSGSMGFGIEMVIWDNGKKRGSRVYAKSSFDLIFSAPTYASYVNHDPQKSINDYSFSSNGDIVNNSLYMGFGIDAYIGGTFPMTDLFWGIGSGFNFLFPTNPDAYKNKIYNLTGYYIPMNFYATPSLLLGYDIFIPNTNFKITPQLRTGFTCLPLIPKDLMSDSSLKDSGGKEFKTKELYSGFYIDLSVAFSFYAIQWKK